MSMSKIPPHGNVHIEIFPEAECIVIRIVRDDGKELSFSLPYHEFENLYYYIRDIVYSRE